MIVAKGRDISEIELLYLCDDDFKSDIKKIRKKFSIKTEKDEKEEVVSVEDILDFDNKLICDLNFRDIYFLAIDKLAEEHEIGGLDEDLQIFVESGETHYTFGKHGIRRPRIFSKPRVELKDVFGLDAKHAVSLIGVNVSFSVKKYVLMTDLNKWFKLHAEDIVLQCNDHLADFRVGITKKTKAERIVRLIQLRENRPELTWVEIAEIIRKDNPDDPDSVNDVINEKSCLMMYQRYKKRFKK